jgi:hypothetical protein
MSEEEEMVKIGACTKSRIKGEKEKNIINLPVPSG